MQRVEEVVRRTAVALVACALTVVLFACGGDQTHVATPSLAVGSPATSATAEPLTPTPAPAATVTIDTSSPCPVDLKVCATAKRVEELLIDGRTSELFVGAKGLPVTCPGGVNPGLDGRFPLCQGAAVGEIRLGFAGGRFQSEGGTGDAAGLIRMIDDWTAAADGTRTDEMGGGAPRAYTVGCRVQSGEPNCDGSFAVVLSAILTSGTRELLDLVFVVETSGESHIVAAYTGLAGC